MKSPIDSIETHAPIVNEASEAVQSFHSARRNMHAAPESREILCADQVASWLGVNRKTVYNAAARGKLPCQRLGKRMLFSREAIGVWLCGTPQIANTNHSMASQ